MTTALNEGATLRDLLFGDSAGTAADNLTDTLHREQTLAPMIVAAPALGLAERELAEVIDGLLDKSLVDIVADGWKSYAVLKDAARRTRDAPGTKETVMMGTHKIEYSHRPQVDLQVNGIAMGTVQIVLQATCTLKAVRAVITGAQLTAIKSGTCTAAGTLSVAGVEVAKRERKLDLPGEVGLHRRITLIGAADAVSAPTQ